MRYVTIRYDTIRYVTIRYEQIQNRYEQVHVSGSHSLNTTRLKTTHEEAARRTNATASFLCALFDKPIRLRASVRAVRKTNQNYCLCSPQCGFRFVRRWHTKTSLLLLLLLSSSSSLVLFCFVVVSKNAPSFYLFTLQQTFLECAYMFDEDGSQVI